MSFNMNSFNFDNFNGTMSFPEEKVEGEILSKEMFDSVHFIKSKLFLKDNITVDSNSQINGIIIDYNLSGDVVYNSKLSSYNLSTSSNRTDIELIKDESTQSLAQKGDLNKITLILEKEFLEKNIPLGLRKDDLLSKLESRFCHEVLASRNTTYPINKILNEIFSNNIYENDLEHIFLQSKVLELIYYELNSLLKEQKTSKEKVKFSESDINALKKAKELILQNNDNYTISTLAKKVALNEFKLKYGFKKYFNTSPGNMILEEKMKKAKKLLETSEYNINEVSKLVGYKYQQSFTNSFIKYFGIRPKDVIKTKKYYY